MESSNCTASWVNRTRPVEFQAIAPASSASRLVLGTQASVVPSLLASFFFSSCFLLDLSCSSWTTNAFDSYEKNVQLKHSTTCNHWLRRSSTDLLSVMSTTVWTCASNKAVSRSDHKIWLAPILSGLCIQDRKNQINRATASVVATQDSSP